MAPFRSLIHLAAVALIMFASAANGQPQLMGTAITFQGQLRLAGQPVTQATDFQFLLFDALTVGTQIGPLQSRTLTPTAGSFTTDLDFGATAFNGDARFLQIAVRSPAGSGAFTTLTPRQRLSPVPYAMALPGLFTIQTSITTSPNLVGGFNGNEITAGVIGGTIGGGGGSLSGEFDLRNRVTDSFGTVAGGVANTAGNSTGTTSDANNATVGGGQLNVARAEGATVAGGSFNSAAGSDSSIGGGTGNNASGPQSTIGGGDVNTASGVTSTVAGGADNTALGVQSVVAGGVSNDANADHSTIGGGRLNLVTGLNSTIGGGDTNKVQNINATIGGGRINTANGSASTIAGGIDNIVSGSSGTIGGGFSNVAEGSQSTVAGGKANVATSLDSSIGGGSENVTEGQAATIAGGASNDAFGAFASVPGGQFNAANGAFSFAAGRRAKANHTGSFVWGDATNGDVASSATNQFTARCTGGVRFFSNSALSAGVTLAAGSGSWGSVSDRNAKEHFTPVESRQILERVVALPLMTWNYKSQDDSIRHIGPMAQAFYAAFGVGEDDRHISTVDADGVALTAIQGLHALVQEKETRINELADRVAALEALVNTLVHQNNR